MLMTTSGRPETPRPIASLGPGSKAGFVDGLPLIQLLLDELYRLARSFMVEISGKVLYDVRETHRMRCFSDDDLRRLLGDRGYAVRELCAVLTLGRVPTPADRRFAVIAETA